MAEPIPGASVHRLSISRRSVVVGGASALAAPALVMPAPVVPMAVAGGADPDAALLRRVGMARRLRAEAAAAWAERRRRARLMYDHPDYPSVLVTAEQHARHRALERWTACDAAALHARRVFRRYGEETRAAMLIPAHTPRGLAAKLRLGLRAARQGHARVFEYEDRDWLASAIADLERMG